MKGLYCALFGVVAVLCSIAPDVSVPVQIRQLSGGYYAPTRQERMQYPEIARWGALEQKGDYIELRDWTIICPPKRVHSPLRLIAGVNSVSFCSMTASIDVRTSEPGDWIRR